MAEFLGMYVRMWLTLNPPLPEEEKDAALRMAQQRYDQFIQALGKRIGSGQSVFTDLPREVVVKAENFAPPKEAD